MRSYAWVPRAQTWQRGLRANFPEIEKDLERLKWNLWHGNVHKALQIVEDLEFGSDLEELSQEQRKCKRLTIPTCSSAGFFARLRG
jgi:hypothetical protein